MLWVSGARCVAGVRVSVAARCRSARLRAKMMTRFAVAGLLGLASTSVVGWGLRPRHRRGCYQGESARVL